MTTLGQLASEDSYRKHVVADGLQQYIEEGRHTRIFLLCEIYDIAFDKEYKTSWKLLKNTRTDDIWELIDQNESAFGMFTNFLAEASGEMPLVCIAMSYSRLHKSITYDVKLYPYTCIRDRFFSLSKRYATASHCL